MTGRLLVAAFASCAVACSTSASHAASDGGGDAASDDAGDDSPTLPINDPLDPRDDASVPSRVAQVFRTRCSGLGTETFCHGSGAGGMHLVLGDGGDVVGVRASERADLFRVAPGDPIESYLFLKVLGDGGIDGSRMPADGTTFDPRIPTLMGEWIEAGALSP